MARRRKATLNSDTATVQDAFINERSVYVSNTFSSYDETVLVNTDCISFDN